MAYRKVYLRIKCNCYNSGYGKDSGWTSDEDAAAFNEESRRIFQELGWTLHADHNGACDTVTIGHQDLYLHPTSFSGVMDEANTNLGGCFVDLMDGRYRINPLEPKAWSVDEEDPGDDNAPDTFRQRTLLSQHISFLKDFFRSYKDFTDAHIDTIELMLERLYAKWGINDGSDFSSLSSGQFPILSDLYDVIEDAYQHYENEPSPLYPRGLLREVLLGLHSLCRGAESKFFNGHTNITSSRFLVFGVKGLLQASGNVKNAMLFNVLSFLSDKLLTVGNTVATLDELYTAAPAMASTGPFNPIEVETYTYGPFDELRVNKVYQLSVTDDPSGIPTEDFEQGDRRYYLLDMAIASTDNEAVTYTITDCSGTIWFTDLQLQKGPALNGYTPHTEIMLLKFREDGKIKAPVWYNGVVRSEETVVLFRGKLIFSILASRSEPHALVFVVKMFPILLFCKVENSSKDKNKTQRRKAPGLVFLCRGESVFAFFALLPGKIPLPHDRSFTRIQWCRWAWASGHTEPG